MANLPPLITTTAARTVQPPKPSYAKNRLSTFSNTSGAQSRSRPPSSAYPTFHSSLSYANVRDFAYPSFHLLHYGPTPQTASGITTPASEIPRRLSDPSVASWEGSRGHWSAGPWGEGWPPTPESYGEQQLPQTSFGDGPPYEEDEDLHSPIVTSGKQHRKHKSNVVGLEPGRGRSRDGVGTERRSLYAGTNFDGSQTYYVSELDEAANGPGGEYITYPAGGHDDDASFYRQGREEHHSDDDTSPDTSPGLNDNEASRYSRNYQFTIASPDEEMHGKAVALFDFARENENELPLVEGQIILVSYRHGQGWLVAEDPTTGESGLVPEEYVRLLRDIEGGWPSVSNQGGSTDAEDAPAADAGLYVDQKSSSPPEDSHARAGSGNSSGSQHYTPVVSSFSTTSKDFEPHPQHQGSDSTASTPTTARSPEGVGQRRLSDIDDD